jgi:hypothetical protein
MSAAKGRRRSVIVVWPPGGLFLNSSPAGQFQGAEHWLDRFERDRGYYSTRMVSKIRAWYDLARCREAAGDRDGALGWYRKFLSRWSTPDEAAPEIEDALRRFEVLAGKPWEGGKSP